MLVLDEDALTYRKWTGRLRMLICPFQVSVEPRVVGNLFQTPRLLPLGADPAVLKLVVPPDELERVWDGAAIDDLGRRHAAALGRHVEFMNVKFTSPTSFYTL